MPLAEPLAHNPDFQDFRNFLWRVWDFLNLPDPTPVQYDIAQWMQTGPRRQITEAFRGVGKSWIAGAFVCWKLYLDPQKKIMIVSSAKSRADAFSIFVKRLIAEMPELQHLAPGKDQRDSNIAFDVGPATNDQSPSVKSVGITGMITGSRADVIIADDVESLNNSATPEQRTKLAERVKEFDAVLKPGGSIIYLGTPQTEFSIYGELETRGYECRIWPARIPDAASVPKYGKRLARMIIDMATKRAAGTTTDPLRFSDIDLAEREASYGRSGFALQFQLDTSLSDADRYPLRLSDMIVLACNPDLAPAKAVWAAYPDKIVADLPNVGLKGDHYYHPMEVQGPWGEYTGCVMSIDPSGRGKDETAYSVVKTRHGQLYLVASGGFQDGYSKATLEGLASIAKKHGAKEIIVEKNFGDGMFAALLRPVLTASKYPCTVTEVSSTGQKERRIIDVMEPVLNQHRLIVSESVIRDDVGGVDEEGATQRNPQKTLMWQLTRITKDKGALRHDDRLDALAMAVAYWVEAMNRDVDEATTEAHKAHLEACVEDFMESMVVLGEDQFDAREKTWINS